MLVAIGISLNSFGHNDLRTLRLPGVLQRLGVCYLIIGVMEAAQMKLQNVQQPVPRVCSWLQDLIDAWPQWLFVIAITAVHTALTIALPVPGCPT
jgi:heparan-alpha-glucosaminide N-acetyltransferase